MPKLSIIIPVYNVKLFWKKHSIGRALYSTYSSTKAGVVNLTQALAEELASENIRINVINPERTATPMRLKAFGNEPPESLLQPEKVAEAS